MLNPTLKLLRSSAVLALCAVFAGQVLAANPVYVFKNYTPGVKGDYALSLSSASLGFGSIVAGNSSASQTVTLSNAGMSPVSVTALTAAAGFTQTNNCGFIQPGAGCEVAVTFSPPATDAYAGNLAIAYDSGRQVTVALTGTGTPASAIGSLSTASLAFGPVQVGADATQTVTLSNSGGSNLSVSSITADNAVFTVPAGCTAVAVGTPCVIDVKFTPTTSGAVSGTLTVVDNAAGSPRTVTLSGTGNTPLASLSTTSLDLGSVGTGLNNTLGVQLNNTGNQALAVSAVTVAGSPSFSATNDCSSVAPGDHCTANVNFAPVTTGPVTGTLSFATNAPGSPQTVALLGTGYTPNVFATWNPSDIANTGLLSNRNLSFATSGSSFVGVRATLGKSVGKWYWEVTIAGGTLEVGIAKTSVPLSVNADCLSQPVGTAWCYYGGGLKLPGFSAYGTTFGAGSVVGVAVDLDAHTIAFYNDGVYQGVAWTNVSGTIYPYVVNRGTPVMTANFGATPFVYPVPAGFNAGIWQ